MEKDIEKIIEKYWDADEEYYSSMRYEGENEEEFWMKKELEEYFEKTGTSYKINKEDGFDSPGYENEFLAIAYIDENTTLQLRTVVCETF